ncbi:MAG: hypothetical protein FWB71_00805 [Defluviitaleaceae bacterium]|nr:hypothetical protein [Defluviitaleaceae bacterium]
MKKFDIEQKLYELAEEFVSCTNKDDMEIISKKIDSLNRILMHVSSYGQKQTPHQSGGGCSNENHN